MEFKKIKKMVLLLSSSFIIGGLCKCYQLESQLSENTNEINEDLNEIKDKLDDISEGLDKLDNISEGLDKLDEKVAETDKILEYLKEAKKAERLEDYENSSHVFHQYAELNSLLVDLGITPKQYDQMYDNLLEVRKKLNISADENIKYANTLSIGDPVNLVDPDASIYADIYSLNHGENAATSLYGTSEIRCIKSIVMTNDEVVTEVDNMDDYELFKSIGFQVKGYNLVNQFSLDNDGSLISEFRCNKDDVKYEKRLNKKR